MLWKNFIKILDFDLVSYKFIIFILLDIYLLTLVFLKKYYKTLNYEKLGLKPQDPNWKYHLANIVYL